LYIYQVLLYYFGGICKNTQYRHLANDTTRKKFEEYLNFDPNRDVNTKLEIYLSQKKDEVFKLSEYVDGDIKNYQVELNRYSSEANNMPWWKIL
jgi:hypothetical protein